ncbi:MAG: NUDIX hydrolase [Verrucomicrobia bacterium]|nr:NUDIX hydrolase [Verrucomicrobiota bacterium]
MIELLDTCPDCFCRATFPAHFTGSAFIARANGAQCLLHYHQKLDHWLQFGGHCDGEENVIAVAQREAFEESGISHLVIQSPDPFDLDIQHIPAYGKEPEHLHYDVRYLFIAPAASEARLSPENREMRWFTLREMSSLSWDPGLRRVAERLQALLA